MRISWENEHLIRQWRSTTNNKRSILWAASRFLFRDGCQIFKRKVEFNNKTSTTKKRVLNKAWSCKRYFPRSIAIVFHRWIFSCNLHKREKNICKTFSFSRKQQQQKISFFSRDSNNRTTLTEQLLELYRTELIYLTLSQPLMIDRVLIWFEITLGRFKIEPTFQLKKPQFGGTSRSTNHAAVKKVNLNYIMRWTGVLCASLHLLTKRNRVEKKWGEKKNASWMRAEYFQASKNYQLNVLISDFFSPIINISITKIW